MEVVVRVNSERIGRTVEIEVVGIGDQRYREGWHTQSVMPELWR
jgi:hypothetical protein